MSFETRERAEDPSWRKSVRGLLDCESDDQGRFRLDVPQPGEYTLRAGLNPLFTAEEHVSVARNTARSEVEMWLAAEGLAVASAAQVEMALPAPKRKRKDDTAEAVTA